MKIASALTAQYIKPLTFDHTVDVAIPIIKVESSSGTITGGSARNVRLSSQDGLDGIIKHISENSVIAIASMQDSKKAG